MCDCIEKVRSEFLADTPAVKWLDIRFSTIRTRKDGRFIGGYKTGQEIVYEYEHTKKNGNIVMKKERTFITHDFCPWCGQKY